MQSRPVGAQSQTSSFSLAAMGLGPGAILRHPWPDAKEKGRLGYVTKQIGGLYYSCCCRTVSRAWCPMLYPSAPIPKAKTPPIVCATWLFAIWLAAASLAHGRAFEVLLLKGTEQNGVWGTEEFSLTVTSQGVVRHVKVRGQLLVWQAVSLYASPMPPGAKAGVRTVQGEPPGKTGLAMSLPKMSVRSDRGSRIFLLGTP